MNSWLFEMSLKEVLMHIRRRHVDSLKKNFFANIDNLYSRNYNCLLFNANKMYCKKIFTTCTFVSNDKISFVFLDNVYALNEMLDRIIQYL